MFYIGKVFRCDIRSFEIVVEKGSQKIRAGECANHLVIFDDGNESLVSLDHMSMNIVKRSLRCCCVYIRLHKGVNRKFRKIIE